MILDMNGCITTNVHLICFVTSNKNKFLTTHPKLSWTDNFNFARCYKTIDEALLFIDLPIVKSFIGDEIVRLVWTDTKEDIKL